jgi:hypothetical protein
VDGNLQWSRVAYLRCSFKDIGGDHQGKRPRIQGLCEERKKGLMKSGMILNGLLIDAEMLDTRLRSSVQQNGDRSNKQEHDQIVECLPSWPRRRRSSCSVTHALSFDLRLSSEDRPAPHILHKTSRIFRCPNSRHLCSPSISNCKYNFSEGLSS